MTKQCIKALCTLTATIVLFCARTNASAPSHREEVERRAQWGWTTESWLADDKPYINLRQRIDSMTVRGQRPAIVFETYKKYEKAAKTSPADPLALFAWGYSGYRASLFRPLPGPVQLDQVIVALATTPSPRSYQFARARFLIEMRRFPESRLKVLGERLLRRNPKDYSVIHYFLEILRPAIPAEKKRALQLAALLIRAEPNKPSGYAALGLFRYRSWLVSNSRNDARKSIAAYRTYMQVAKLNQQDLRQIESMIQRMQKGRGRSQS